MIKVKNINRPLLVLAAMIALSLNACQKIANNETVTDPNPSAQPLLVRMEKNATNYITAGYSTAGLLNKFKTVNDYYTLESHFGYDTNKKPLNGVNTAFEYTLVYNTGVLDKVEYISKNPNQQGDYYTKFTYTNGRVSQTVDYFKQGNNYMPGGKMLYEYYANGDVRMVTYLYLVALPNHFEQVERTVYEYDDKKNAWQMPDELFYILKLPKSAHNVKTAMVYNASDSLNETRSYSVNYNSFGLPTTGVENITYPNSPAVNTGIKFYYQ